MPNLLNTLLPRWDVDPPILSAEETTRWDDETWSFAHAHKLLKEATPADWADCQDCGRRCDIEYLQTAQGTMQCIAYCADCGLDEVPQDQLRRWEIDTSSMITAIFRDAKLSIKSEVSECLWRVGKATWAGRSRQLWFARLFPGSRKDAVEILRRNTKAVVFVPTSDRVSQWREAAGNLVIPLEEVVSIGPCGFSLDVEDIQGQILDTWPSHDHSQKNQSKRRGSRLNNIARLRKAVIEHLLLAREHAYSTEELTKTPRLLPRPQQKELAKQLDMTTSDVNRALKDDDAVELQIYWELALDLDQIMSFKGPITRGRKT